MQLPIGVMTKMHDRYSRVNRNRAFYSSGEMTHSEGRVRQGRVSEGLAP